jgi:hypothetical protein
MTACRDFVDDFVDDCERTGSGIARDCGARAGERQRRCVEFEEESYERCDRFEDQGYRECTDWAQCSWDQPWACVTGLICIATTWVENVVCVATTWVTSTVCRAYAWVEAGACRIVDVAATAGCRGLGGLMGLGCRGIDLLTYRIEESRDEPGAASVERFTAESMSIADVEGPLDYRDTGTNYQFRIVEGRVWFRTPAEDWREVAPDGEAAQAVSYHRLRAGELSKAPVFDMVAANSGRVFAKEKGVARFYFTMLEPMFRVTPRDSVPSMYFKLDPEQGISTADNRDRLRHLDVADRDHPAAARFPLFRHAMSIDLNDTMIVNVDAHLRVWHRIDGRPPMFGGSPPLASALPGSETVVSYRSNMPFGGVTAMDGYRARLVQDIGVGHVNWHDQRCAIHGGEMDSLDGRGLPPCLPGREAYRLFNGPVEDQGGLIDGTVNYYVLAQFEEGEWDDDDAVSKSAFAILWLDEQAVLSERWRLLDPADCRFGSFKDVVPSAIVQYLDKDFWFESFEFDRSKYWCPMRAGYVTPRSRMAVSRAVVVVSGRDPATRQWELYSINFGFGTADRTWRWRSLPPRDGHEHSVPPGRFGLREDMTLYVHERHRESKDVVWYQKYLPASTEVRPTSGELRLRGAREGDKAPDRDFDVPKPERGFAHPWQWLPEPLFRFVHTRSSHFGCYERSVDSRWQYYRVEILEGGDALRSMPEATRWVESGDALFIPRDAIDWPRLNNILRGGSDPAVSQDLVARLVALAGSIPGGVCGAISGEAARFLFGSLSTASDVGPVRTVLCQMYAELRGSPLVRERHRRGLFEDRFSLKLRDRGPTGWIMTHADKRDDDLLPFRDFTTESGTPFELVLRPEGDADTTVRVRVSSYHNVVNVPMVEDASVSSTILPDGRGELRVRVLPCASDETLDENLWRIKLGCLTRDASGELDGFDVLFDGIRSAAPRSSRGPGAWHEYAFDLDASTAKRVGERCSESLRLVFGTSLWFEDVVGHVATADRVEFATFRKDLPPP